MALTVTHPGLMEWCGRRYQVHPAAAVFPMMDEAIDLRELVKDINKHGLRHPILIETRNGTTTILDGRNRLEALARLEVDPDQRETYPPHTERLFEEVTGDGDRTALVISLNIRRRHLTKAEQADLIVKSIEASHANDRATTARSFSPTTGKKGGSTQDPTLAKAVAEGKKIGIGKRTIQTARAKAQGKPLAPRKPVASTRGTSSSSTPSASAPPPAPSPAPTPTGSQAQHDAEGAIVACLRRAEKEFGRAATRAALHRLVTDAHSGWCLSSRPEAAC